MWGITLAGSFLFALTLCEKPVKTVKETRRNGNTRFPACCGQHMRAAMRAGERWRTAQAANGGEAAQTASGGGLCRQQTEESLRK